MISPLPPLPRVARDDVAWLAVLARWIGASHGLGRRVAALAGGPVVARGVSVEGLRDAHAARCEVRVSGASIEVLGASAGVRRIAQRVLGGPSELPAPRPLGAVEHAIWALVVAAALEDLGVAGQVHACEGPLALAGARELAIDLDLAGAPFTVAIRAPRALALRSPQPPRVPAWADRARVDAAIVLGRSAIPRADLRRLAPRAIVTVERVHELAVLGGALGVSIARGAVVAEVATGYLPRAMPLPDDAHVELTVGLGAQLTLRQVLELAVGQVVPLGRPLAAPFEVRAAGAVVGHGELVDVDGELGVRITSVASAPTASLE